MQGCGAQWCWQELQCRLERRRDSVWLTPFQPPLPGLDQADHDDLFSAFMGNTDVARETLALRRMVKSMQDSCAALEKVSLGPSLSLPLYLPSFLSLSFPSFLLTFTFLFLPPTRPVSQASDSSNSFSMHGGRNGLGDSL